MKTTLIFIHGMFQNAKSWTNWISYFSERGYNCVAESWPLHEGEPSDLRRNPPVGLGDLSLDEVISKYSILINNLGTGPVVLIGHSVGGLIVQHLVNKGLGDAGVCISSVAPNKMLAFDWAFFKNSFSIANPLKGDEIFEMTPEGFQSSFANTMTEEESNVAYELTATHDSRNILRDCMGDAGEIDLEKTTRPLLFIGGKEDQIIPAELNKKNAEAYADGLAVFEELYDRGHYICNEPGWEAVIDLANSFIERVAIEENQNKITMR